MKNLMWHMNVDTAMEFYKRVAAKELLYKRTLDEKERTKLLFEMVEEGLIESVIGTDRTKEEIIRDAAKHGKVLHVDADGKTQISE